MLRTKTLKTLIIAILATALPVAAIAEEEVTRLNVSYDPTRELYYDGCEECHI